ncbi:hypothetical protein HAX54_038734 [Datura stramonium]|uniref:WW domain-containing protein n=1 Tax=Datura stramonium TaxID=4076 RepID=A0ABS8VLM3_DATST|nr:hypothetical protein [Datura stramonium]
MIQLGIKKALRPAKGKLNSLCSMVEVLESEVVTLRKEVAALSAPPSTSHPTPYEHVAIPAQPEAPRSPLDDWWVGVAMTYYHELRTLPDKWVVPGPGKSVELPPDPLQSKAEETALWHFDAATYT